MLSLGVGESLLGQASKAKVSKGPRALGLIELLPKGKARLIPVVILIDGQYYDAGAYKASPVPMALWAETEYEGFRTGVSQGFFTVTGALENQKTNEWIAEGNWVSAESLTAKSAKKPGSSIPRGLEDDSGPPVLRHSGSAKPKPPDSTPASNAQPSPPESQPAASQNPSAGSSGQAQTASTPTPTTSSGASTAASTTDQEDPNRPTLKRGKPALNAPQATLPAASPPPKSPTHQPAPSASAKAPQSQLIPAISDGDGPEAHSYAFDAKPDEELNLRNKMLALAADEVRTRAKQLSTELAGLSAAPLTARTRTANRAAAAQPKFDDVRFRLFDLSSSNEPVMVLSATAQMPAGTTEGGLADLQYFVTLVGRQDINGDIHKAFSNITDRRHLDVEPKFELIDAVDVDGDGRAELLFRKTYDEGSAFVVYRVIGNQLYPLFDGVPAG